MPASSTDKSAQSVSISRSFSTFDRAFTSNSAIMDSLYPDHPTRQGAVFKKGDNTRDRRLFSRIFLTPQRACMSFTAPQSGAQIWKPSSRISERRVIVALRNLRPRGGGRRPVGHRSIASIDLIAQELSDIFDFNDKVAPRRAVQMSKSKNRHPSPTDGPAMNFNNSFGIALRRKGKGFFPLNIHERGRESGFRLQAFSGASRRPFSPGRHLNSRTIFHAKAD